MTAFYDIGLNPQKLKDYQEKDLGYKTQVRDLICNKLGYEPLLNVSILSEIILRSAFRRYDLGETSKQDLDNNIEFQVKFINKQMLNEASSYHC